MRHGNKTRRYSRPKYTNKSEYEAERADRLATSLSLAYLVDERKLLKMEGSMRRKHTSDGRIISVYKVTLENGQTLEIRSDVL
jgi:hypothetical protein